MATGDINGDGIADAVIGAPGARYNNRSGSGSVHVIFGTSQAGPVDLGNLGSDGFRIDGAETSDGIPDGQATADFNGDGKDDVLMGTPTAGSGGTAYVVFGRTATTPIDLNSLGTAGVQIDAAAPSDSLGADVANVGDLNGDGKDDIAIGANQADPGGSNSGATYIVLGRTSTTSMNAGSLGIGGFTIEGAATMENGGSAVANAGDVNADGRDDLVIGAFSANANSRTQSGSAFVVFGQAVPGDVDLASLGSAGFRMDGALPGDFFGFSVAGIGDINDDGRDDMAIGAPNADFGGTASGSTYVILGRTSPGNLDLASLGAEGFRIDGAAGSDLSGSDVTGADVNDDGVDDLLICAPQAKHSFNLAGATYAVFGGPSVANRLLTNISEFGVRLDGGSLGERSCSGAAVADINNDGGIDILIGAQTADFNSRIDSGSVYVVLGASKLQPSPSPSVTPQPTPAPSAQAGAATLVVKARAAGKNVPRDGKAVLVKRSAAGPGQSRSITVKVTPKRARKAITVKIKKGPGSVKATTDAAPRARIKVTIRATGSGLTPTTFSRAWKVR